MRKRNHSLAFAAVAAMLVAASATTTRAENQAAFSPQVKTLSGLSETFTVEITSPVIECDPIKQKGVVVGEDCHWPVTADLRALVTEGNGDANALSYISLSKSSLTFTSNGDKQSVDVTVDVPASAAPGYYQFQVKLFDPVPSGPLPLRGWGGGPGTTINVTVTEPVVIPVDTTEPVVTFSSPAEGAQLAYCAGGTPLSFAFDAVEDGMAGSTIASMAANVNGSAVPIVATGLGTVTASATGEASVAGIGTFTINASATNTFDLTGSASRDVSVSYALGWLPPLALGKVHNGGRTVPVKFTVRDCRSNFVHDESVNVVIYETSATGAPERLNGVFGEGASSVRIDDVAGQYIINFPTETGARTYRVDIYFQGWANGQSGQWIKQGTTTFTTR